MSSALKPSDPMTVAEFLGWEAPADRHWQLVDGEPVAMAPASRTHGSLQHELGRLIGNHLVDTGSPLHGGHGPWYRAPGSLQR